MYHICGHDSLGDTIYMFLAADLNDKVIKILFSIQLLLLSNNKV